MLVACSGIIISSSHRNVSAVPWQGTKPSSNCSRNVMIVWVLFIQLSISSYYLLLYCKNSFDMMVSWFVVCSFLTTDLIYRTWDETRDFFLPEDKREGGRQSWCCLGCGKAYFPNDITVTKTKYAFHLVKCDGFLNPHHVLVELRRLPEKIKNKIFFTYLFC